MTLSDMLELTADNDQCVLLEFKDTVTRLDKILTGVLNGDEIMIRVTKGPDQRYTVYKSNGTHWGWTFGASGFTLVSEETHELRRLINAVVAKYGIALHKDHLGRWRII